MTSYLDILPLRKTSAWLGYRDLEFIPLRYGDASGRAIQYDAARRQFVWADGASGSIREVRVAGVAVAGWQWRNDQDNTGAPVTLIEFSQPVDSGAEVTALGTGRMHSRTGATIDNPAAVIWDLLTFAGISVAETVFDDLRADCDRLGIVSAGSLTEAVTIQSAISAICSSHGLAFSAGMADLVRVYLGGTLQYSAHTIDSRYELDPDCDADDLVNDVTISFGYLGDEPQETVQVEAPDSVALYGRRSATIEARWIGSSRVAAALAVRTLERYARPTIRYACNGVKAELRVGDTVTLDHPYSPIAGDAFVLTSAVDLARGQSDITFAVPVGQTPRTSLVGQSAKHEAQSYAGASIQTVGSDRKLTITDELDRPLAGVVVTLDGQYQRQTDAGGVAVFPASIMPLGSHTLAVLGGPTITVLVQ